ncbi:Major latex protein domain containing protein [Trema orientale]|uniref:Major latex protein domain containing protein n=1 Tax=Trema orientale TaxID=63057 RepID=A0A2P5B9E4_TREOI|nr:Major latex protein domain containing protein [Trema orientale]
MAAELGNKLDVHVDTTVPADQFYGFFKNNMPRFVQLFPRNIKTLQIQGGGGVRPGAVMLWKYDIGITGSPMTAKVRVQSIDDENRTLVLEALEGDVLKVYKSFKAKIQFNDVDNGASKVIWGLEYEKASENAPEPDHYVNFMVKVAKGLDAHLRKA